MQNASLDLLVSSNKNVIILGEMESLNIDFVSCQAQNDGIHDKSLDIFTDNGFP